MASNIYRDKKLFKDAENERNDIKILLNKLRNYYPAKPKKIKAKEKTLSAAEKLLNNRQEVIDAFKTGIFPYIDGFQRKIESEEESKEESEEKMKDHFTKFIEYIENESKDINYDLFKDYFKFVVPSALVKKLYEIKKKTSKLVNVIKSGLNDLKDGIKETPEDEKKFEQPAKTLKIVEEILEFNKQNQSGKGLKILTPNQMLSRLPISLAQLKAGNNSEIRQLLYSLYRSKKLTKQLYKSLIDII